MNTFKGILANQELARQSNNALRFSTIQEGLLLHDAKMFPSGQLTDFGLAIYSMGEPNKKLSESLVPQAQSKTYTVPVLASFISLGLQTGGEEYGVTPTLNSDMGLIHGAEAVQTLKRFVSVGKSGVQWLGRYLGYWNCGWYDVDDFNAGSRVVRISGEASAKNLQALVQTQIEQNFSKERSELQQKLQNLDASERNCIESAQAVLNR